MALKRTEAYSHAAETTSGQILHMSVIYSTTNPSKTAALWSGAAQGPVGRAHPLTAPWSCDTGLRGYGHSTEFYLHMVTPPLRLGHAPKFCLFRAGSCWRKLLTPNYCWKSGKDSSLCACRVTVDCHWESVGQGGVSTGWCPSRCERCIAWTCH